MSIDYIAEFPIPAASLPERLRALLAPEDSNPRRMVDVTSRYEADTYGPRFEYVHMIMAVVPDEAPEPLPLLEESSDGVVSYSVPTADRWGISKHFTVSISGYDYVVASWGDGSHYSYSLSEKVWMALGLTPRCVGNDRQRVIYDDLSLPEFGVAEGEVSTEYYWSPKRDVTWRMSNEYLRKYLWMRGARGVRVFYYETLVPDIPAIRDLMGGGNHAHIQQDNCWFRLDIREDEHGLRLQVWGTVSAVSSKLCPDQSADGIVWPGIDGPMTHLRANSLVHDTPVFLDDRFLERYEQSTFYKTTPVRAHGKWWCSPAYKGQWSFTDCVRVGRNLICVPIRELYKGKPDREILHAHRFALEPALATQFDLQEEHVVSKVQRLLDQLLDLGDNLSALAGALGVAKAPEEIVGFSRREVLANGWLAYPQFSRLAQVVPLDMTQQAFLSRCKNLHEIWQRIPDGFLRTLLEKAGCPKKEINSLKSLKLLQALLNILLRLNANEDAVDALASNAAPEGWGDRNAALMPLFLNNDLRIADAHEALGNCLEALEGMGFDIAEVNQGYGRALDFVMDGVVEAFSTINREAARLLAR